MNMGLNVKCMKRYNGNPLYETGQEDISSQTSLQADLTSVSIDCHRYF